MRNILIVLSFAFSVQAFANPLSEFFENISKEIDRNTDVNQRSIYSPTTTTPILPSGDMRWCLQAPLPATKLNHVNYDKTQNIEAFCQELRDENPLYPQCYEDCEKRFAAGFNRIKEEKEQRALAEQQANATRLAQQEEAERKAASDKQELEALNRDLVSGRVKPTNIDQAIIAFDAKDGESIVKSPKINPDNKLYHLIGTIEKASSDLPEFIGKIYINYAFAALSPSILSINPYFYVNITEELQAYYFDNARIGGYFSLVGKYVANTEYETVAGQEKTAPVFEAIYFQ